MTELYLKENNQLYLKLDEKEVEVEVKRCFPRSYSEKFLSLRNKDDEEMLLIEDMSKLESHSKEALEKILSIIDFKLNITEILAIEEEVELRNYQVMTTSGFRKIQTRLDDWPDVLANGKILIKDLSGDCYLINHWSELNKNSQKLLATYVH